MVKSVLRMVIINVFAQLCQLLVIARTWGYVCKITILQASASISFENFRLQGINRVNTINH